MRYSKLGDRITWTISPLLFLQRKGVRRTVSGFVAGARRLDVCDGDL